MKYATFDTAHLQNYSVRVLPVSREVVNWCIKFLFKQKIHCCYRVKTNQLVNNDQSIVCIVLRFHKYFISKHLFGRRNIIG